MKILFGVCVALVFSSSSVTLSTSVLEFNTNTSESAIFNDILPLEFSRLKNIPNKLGNINRGSQANEGILASFLPNSRLKPLKTIPEPAAMLLFGTGLVGLAMFSRKKMNK